MRTDETSTLISSTAFAPSYPGLDKLVVGTQPSVGDQQVKMALAAITPRIELSACSVSGDPWYVAPPAVMQEVAEELEVADRVASARSVERTLRCPYCRSMTYEVRVTNQPMGLAATGACSLCGTHGESFHPARRRELASAKAVEGSSPSHRT